MTAPERKPRRRLHFLVVEDEPDTRQTWTWFLQALGHDVQTAADGHGALRLAEATWPDVILLDLGLPDMAGYEVAAQLRQHKGNTRPLIIAITGFGEDMERLQSYEAGIDLHLVKPVQPDELKTYIEHFQNLHKHS